MFCGICNKKTANYVISYRAEEDKREYVCEECAYAKGLFYTEGVTVEKIEADRCPVCGTTLADFKATGLFGCPYCYTHFYASIARGVEAAQGGNGEHRGKVALYSKSQAAVREVAKLKSRLNRAVRENDSEAIEKLTKKLEEWELTIETEEEE